MGGLVAAGGLTLVVLIALYFLLPALLAAGWFFGWWSFEASVIGLLLVIAYCSGGVGD
jgi:phage-related holin